MKHCDVKSIVTARIKAGITRPLYLESSPGLGKTQLALQCAQELGLGFKAIHAPLLQPEDYGFPVISMDKQDVNFVVSRDKFPLETSDCAVGGIFLIDELSQADNSAQKIIANLLQEREIHGQRLRPDWTVIATGNRTTDRAGANRILSHLKNRMTTIELETSLDDWTQWALDHGIKPEVIAFLRFRPELLNSFNAQLDTNPTPRAWSEGVSKGLGEVNPQHEFEMFKGDVGEGAAAEFCAFLKIFRKLPSPDLIVLNPLTAELPNDPATVYATCGALAHKATPGNFARIMQYVARMSPEFSVLFVRDAIKKTPAIQTTSDFIRWASGPGASLLS